MALTFSRMTAFVDTVLAEFADARCLHCGFPVRHRTLCAACAVPELSLGARCERCDATVPAPLPRCGRCVSGFLAPVASFRSAAAYLGPYRTLLVRGKLSGVRAWIEAMAPLTEVVAPRLPRSIDAIVPVPAHRRRWAERGFNAAEIVARALRRHVDAPLLPLLERTKHEAPLSAGASRRERRQAVERAFRARSASAIPPVVLLVDDVLTTGATLAACARALRRAGASQVHAFAMLRAPDPLTGKD